MLRNSWWGSSPARIGPRSCAGRPGPRGRERHLNQNTESLIITGLSYTTADTTGSDTCALPGPAAIVEVRVSPKATICENPDGESIEEAKSKSYCNNQNKNRRKNKEKRHQLQHGPPP